MNRYQPNRFNPMMGIAAVAMTALTFVLAVGVPSGLAAAGPDATSLAASLPVGTAATEVAIIPSRIEVIGSRDTTVADRQQGPRG
ncbi:MAG: hypothetical protein ABI569_09000 [Casimicrobiaceae bacterium]